MAQQLAGRVTNPPGSGLAVGQNKTLDVGLAGMSRLAASPTRAVQAKVATPVFQTVGEKGAAFRFHNSPVVQATMETSVQVNNQCNLRPVANPRQPVSIPRGTTVQIVKPLRSLQFELGILYGINEGRGPWHIKVTYNGVEYWIKNSHLGRSDDVEGGGQLVSVSEEMKQKLDCAQAAIDYARPFITHGPQNQGWARAQHGDQGDVNMAAMISLADTRWRDEGGYNTNWVKPRRIGAAVVETGGGNCQDIAALTYNYLREHARPEWTVCFVVANTVHHAFATIGNPTTDNANQVVVADSWVRFPKACRFSEHFCRGDASLVVHKAKPGEKRAAQQR